MSFLRADGKAALSRAIVAFEARTAAELVIVVEPRAGHYLHVPLAFAALAALAALAFLLYGEPSFALHWFLIDPVVIGLAVAYLTLDLVRPRAPRHPRRPPRRLGPASRPRRLRRPQRLRHPGPHRRAPLHRRR